MQQQDSTAQDCFGFGVHQLPSWSCGLVNSSQLSGCSVGAMPLPAGLREHNPVKVSRVALSWIFMISAIWQLVSLTSGMVGAGGVLSQPAMARVKPARAQIVNLFMGSSPCQRASSSQFLGL